MTDTPRTLTAEEGIKVASDHLRGDLAAQLDSDAPNVDAPSEHLLKFHGVYAQDHRDVRRERALAKEPLEYIFMVRVAIPGGRLSSEQWRTLDDIAVTIADGSIRLTTRQAVQFHGVAKHGLRPLARDLDARLMTSFGGCGDVVRNTVMCPDLAHGAHDGRAATAERIARAFKPRSLAHWEIFVGGERAASREAEHDFYGASYLPRKFKIAVAHPDENCVDVLAQDIGLVPARHDAIGDGFAVVVGGGLGRSYAQTDTFARLAEPLTFVTDDELEDVIAAILATYRDLGDRTNRRRARLKYVVADVGLTAFRAQVEARRGSALRDAPTLVLGAADDHLGWRRGADGSWRLGVRVGAGRVRDGTPGRGLRSALREVADLLGPTFVITAQQDLVIADVAEDERGSVGEVLRRHGVVDESELGSVERTALACPALPTCGQALAEAERALPDVVDALQGALDARGLGRRPLQLRLTGCPNGCARPAVAEVGVVGRTKSSYDLYLGGGPRGDRLATLYREKLTLEQIPQVLGPVFDRWRDEGEAGEAFGDFCARVAPT
ncbi:MAG: NADPH-dependent assimilatory sulfite reductase hemoprotein subunit [Acidobacteriota bacterium]|nr:NADPH-dependent assimilatory sulfite reductase hemoprotein subunit [Acidobacteriota bacterium]